MNYRKSMMTNYKVTTESGTVYLLEQGKWKRDGYDWEQVVTFKAATVENPKHAPAFSEEWVDTEKPVMGRRMFLASFDLWFVSTNVVKIEEYDSLPV
jgi:hypothetical protein